MPEKWRPIRRYRFGYHNSKLNKTLVLEDKGRTTCQARRRSFHQLSSLIQADPEKGSYADWNLVSQVYVRTVPADQEEGLPEDDD